jgi:YD repeat-containing protein
MTIAQQLKVTKFPFVIKNDMGKEIYSEDSDGWWNKREFDNKGQEIYYENSDGKWYKYEYDDKGNVIYYETSYGHIVDSRPKAVPEYTMEELVDKLGHNFKIKK